MKKLTVAQREVIARLGHGLPMRRAGAFGDVRVKETDNSYAEFANTQTLAILERDGLIAAGDFYAVYKLTPRGDDAFKRMRRK